MATLYLDEDVSHQLGSHLEIFGHTIHTTHRSGRAETSDGNQHLCAASSKWTIVIHNRRDFELLHDAWLRWTRAWRLRIQHPGVLIISQRVSYHDNATVIESLLSTHPDRANQLIGYDIASRARGIFDIDARAYRPLL